MDTPGDFPTILSQLWAWVVEGREWLFSGAGVVVLVALFRRFKTRPHPPEHSLVTIQNTDQAVTEAIKALRQELERKEQALTDARQRETAAQERERSLQADLTALKAAIAAIPEQTEIPDAQARIAEALTAAADGNTVLAEAIFSEVEARNVTEGQAAYQAAAEAARHRGALAFLHDTDKAIAAYRRATELDPENADGWNRLGQLLYRTGALDDAETAYRKVESLGGPEQSDAPGSRLRQPGHPL